MACFKQLGALWATSSNVALVVQRLATIGSFHLATETVHFAVLERAFTNIDLHNISFWERGRLGPLRAGQDKYCCVSARQFHPRE